MRSAYWLSVAVVSFSVACAVSPTDPTPSESTTTDAVLSVNRIGLNRIGLNRIGLNRIGLNRIGLNRISANRLRVNLNSSDAMLATDDGREVFSLAVSCAIAEDVTLVATLNGTDYEFPGEMGLAPHWLSQPLDEEGQGWISACMFARANAHEVAIPISMRGNNPGLASDQDEREGWPLEEGAFYGNIFGPTDRPIPWYACRGKDQAAGEFGGLVDRDCAEPDPANPGFTQCGLIYAGDCGGFAADTACEKFVEHGKFYERCHTSPIHHDHGRTPHHLNCDHGDHDHVFREVITTYVTM
jgi:hypothetical protein